MPRMDPGLAVCKADTHPTVQSSARTLLSPAQSLSPQALPLSYQACGHILGSAMSGRAPQKKHELPLRSPELFAYGKALADKASGISGCLSSVPRGGK